MTSAVDARAHEIEAAVAAADNGVHGQDRVWARHSSDKSDIGAETFRVLRRIVRDAPEDRRIRGLSVGSSSEPQFRVLHAACEGGLYLLDRDASGLAAVEERVRRQNLPHVKAVQADYLAEFADAASAATFVRERLDGERVDLVAFHHSLYYAPAAAWPGLMRAVFGELLRAPGAIHAVLMARTSEDERSTSRLYAEFAGRFAGHVNDQDLRELAKALRDDPTFRGAAVSVYASRVRFHAPDFASLMAVVWMVLLHPQVHAFTVEQRREIAEHVWREFWEPGRALVQEQDHLVVYRAV
jgi:hypothetical protein